MFTEYVPPGTLPTFDGKADVREVLARSVYPVVNVQAEGALGDGVHDDTAAINAAIQKITHQTYAKRSALLFFPAPATFYRISGTIDLTEIWDVKVLAASRYAHQRQAVPDVDTDYALFHWFGAPGGVMMLLDYSFGVTLENLSFNGRNVAGVGLALSRTNTQASSVKYVRVVGCDAKYCDVGVRVGDYAANGPDDVPISLEDCHLINNASNGLKVASGNAHVHARNLFCVNNGTAPTGTRGANVWLVAGELFLDAYASDGGPRDADVWADSGGLRVFGAWSDVAAGPFVSAAAMTSACVLAGVKHFDAAMTPANTPYSVVWGGPIPLVLMGCHLYNSVQVNSGNATHVVDLGTRFVAAGATFLGDIVTSLNGYVGIAGWESGVNEARLAVGRPHRTDVGGNVPFSLWGGSQRPYAVASSPGYAVTRMVLDGGAEWLLGNLYYDGTNYKSIAAGPAWAIERSRDTQRLYAGLVTGADPTAAGQTVTLTERYVVERRDAKTVAGGDGQRLGWGTAAPAAGTWARGDVVFNAAAAAGVNLGWVCATAGTPGTWVPFGNTAQAAQGADLASANNLVLGTDGDAFEVTGTTQINLISNVGRQNGAVVTLVFTSTPTVKHNQATSGSNITIQLAGAVDFAATAGDTLTLVLSEIGGTQAWREVARAVI